MELTVKNAKYILDKYLKDNQDKLKHSLRVAKVSKILANIWNAPEEDAIIVALLHDIGKSLTKKEMLSLYMQNGGEIYDFELFETAIALHGKVSALIFEKEFERTEPERFDAIAHAISYHVVGGEDKQGILDKIIYVADNIEPEKDKVLLDKIQSGEIKEINECIKRIIQMKKEKAKLNNRLYNPMMDVTLDNINKEANNEENELEL